MNAVSLFSGVGGLDLGLHRAGWRHVLFAEADSYRRDVLRARFPTLPVVSDVREVEPNRREWLESHGGFRADTRRDLWSDSGLLAGGFPCQDLSVAGRRRGLTGERSGLFFEFARVAESLRPRWLLVENVPGLLSSNGGRDFGVVLGTLADLGYGLAWRILDSRYFGVPQRRRRVFIVGALADGDPSAAAGCAGEVLAVGSRCGWHPATRTEAGPHTAGALGGISPGGGWRTGADEAAVNHLVANALTTDGNRFGGSEDDVNLVATSVTLASDPISAEELAQPSTKRNGDPGVVQFGATVRRLTPTEYERLQGFPDGWTDLGGTPDSKRYAALGDAVTVNVAEWLGHRIASAYHCDGLQAVAPESGSCPGGSPGSVSGVGP